MLTAAAVVVQISPARASWPLFIRKKKQLVSLLSPSAVQTRAKPDGFRDVVCVCVAHPSAVAI